MRISIGLLLLMPLALSAADPADIEVLQRQADGPCLGKVTRACAKTRMVLDHEARFAALESIAAQIQAAGTTLVARDGTGTVIGDFSVPTPEAWEDYINGVNPNIESGTIYIDEGGVFWAIPIVDRHVDLVLAPTFYESSDCTGQPYMDDALRTVPGISGDVATIGLDIAVRFVRFDKNAPSTTIDVGSWTLDGACNIEYTPVTRSRLSPALDLERFSSIIGMVEFFEQ